MFAWLYIFDELNQHIKWCLKCDFFFQVKYLDWTFNFRMSPFTGPSVYDIRFKGERIAYEIGLSEISIYYSGFAPMQVGSRDVIICMFSYYTLIIRVFPRYANINDRNYKYWNVIIWHLQCYLLSILHRLFVILTWK